MIARFLPNGALDESFGVGGVAEDQIPDVEPGGITLDDSGRLLLASYGYEPGVFRFTSTTGSPDPTFSEDGERWFYGASIAKPLQGPIFPDVVSVDGNDVIIAGYYESPNGQHRPLVARLSPGGEFDPSFGNDGSLTLQAGSAVEGLATTSDNRILALLETGRVIRIEPNGKIDRRFGEPSLPRLGGREQETSMMNVDDRGRITLGGAVGYRSRNRRQENARWVTYLDRFLPSGAHDPHFRTVLGRCGEHLSCTLGSIASYPGGNIVATEKWQPYPSRRAESNSTAFVVARYR